MRVSKKLVEDRLFLGNTGTLCVIVHVVCQLEQKYPHRNGEGVGKGVII